MRAAAMTLATELINGSLSGGSGLLTNQFDSRPQRSPSPAPTGLELVVLMPPSAAQLPQPHNMPDQKHGCVGHRDDVYRRHTTFPRFPCFVVAGINHMPLPEYASLSTQQGVWFGNLLR